MSPVIEEQIFEVGKADPVATVLVIEPYTGAWPWYDSTWDCEWRWPIFFPRRPFDHARD